MAERRRRRTRGGSGAVWMFFLVAAVGVMIFSGWQLFRIYSGYRQGEEEYEELASLSAELREKAYKETGGETAGSGEEPEVNGGFPNAEANARWFAELRTLNPEIIGWIRIEGTVIDYPVMQTDDNDYYLTHTWQGTENGAGSIFLEAANAKDFEDYHSLIYGHNMKNGSMFAGLHSYADPSYYGEHSRIYLETPAGSREYQIFSCHMVEAEDELYQIDFSPGELYTEFVNRLRRLSEYDTGVEVSGEDKVITLSTCKGNGALRYVVHAKLIQN
ncbi:MAG: class B sortase [Lachnospiraceae bacterium]|nr:class B sortase [Lachnospiraceae bacterium]